MAEDEEEKVGEEKVVRARKFGRIWYITILAREGFIKNINKFGGIFHRGWRGQPIPPK